NAALVEEAAAAAGSLQDQASALIQVVSLFKLDASMMPAAPVKPAAKPVAKPTLVPPSKSTVVAAPRAAARAVVPAKPRAPLSEVSSSGDEWEQF
ncbi:MAG: methyl-accepting chemotaxis protein, partial [Burkholderiaceae bacterium]|nr:methyl-accepting chemotaxis protein [Burkholderiaceae bacterium]